MFCIDLFSPNWREAVIRESSPGDRGASPKLRAQALTYHRLTVFPGCRAHVTQDVMEHIFDSASTLIEIARTPRPGGMHIYTTPLVNKENLTDASAKLRLVGSVEHIQEPE